MQESAPVEKSPLLLPNPNYWEKEEETCRLQRAVIKQFKNKFEKVYKKLTKQKIREITTVNKCLVWSCRIRTKKSENMSELVSDGSVPVIRNLNEFLEHFFKAHRDDNFLSIKYGNYNVKPDEAEGELIDWTMQYLSYM